MWKLLLITVLLFTLLVAGLSCTSTTKDNVDENGNGNGTDTTSPVTSGIKVTNITESGCTISWTTNDSATSRIEYGTTSSYGSLSTLDTTMVTNHNIDLTGLTDSTTYHFKVRSKDASNNEGISADNTFTTSVAESTEILSHSSYTDSINYYHVVGEVKNIGSSNLSYVKITGTFYNSADTVIDTDFTYTAMDILTPTQKSPFELIVSNTTTAANVDHYALSVSDFNVTGEEPYNGLQILSHSHNIDIIGDYHIVGEIKNNGSQTTTFTNIVATLYNSAGTVIASEYTYSDPTELAVGQTAPFEIIMLQESLSTQVTRAC